MDRNGEQDGGSLNQLRAEVRAARSVASTNIGDHDFVARLSEELRTNVHVMLGFAQLMRRDQKDPLPEPQRQRAQQILDAGNRLMRLLDDACAWAQIRSGEIAVATTSVDVLRVLQHVQAEHQPRAVSRALEVAIGEVPMPAPLAAADSWAVTEIVSKLTANAVAYGKPHGSVTLQLCQVAPERLRISVIDTGIGVPAAEQHKLFRPFPHVARAVLRADGVGLGLATCQALANLMHGSIGFRSVPDQGSEFWLELPVASASIASAPT